MAHVTLRWIAIAIAATACWALWLGARLPMQYAIPGAVLAVLAVVALLQQSTARRYAALVARVEAIKGVRTSAARLAPHTDPLALQFGLSQSLIADLEDSYFRLIRTNIQLLSLKEVGRSIIASLDQERTVRSVLEYLHRGVGFEEFGLFVWRPEDGVFDGGVRRRGPEGPAWEPLRFALPEVTGVVAKSIGRQRSVLIKDAETHPLGTLNGEPLLPPNTFRSYAIVPLVSNSPPGPVWERRACDAAGCPAAPASGGRDWVDKFACEEDPDFWDGGRFRCWSCNGFPVLGVMLVADTGRDAALSKIDLIMLETLGQNLSTVLENARLYDGLKREERFREHVFRGMANGLVSVDLEGRVLLFNQAAETLSGHPESAVRGRPSGELIVETRTGRDPLREALAGGRSLRGVEATLRTADGKALPIQLTTSLLRDENGRAYGAIGEFADLSAIKGMEAQIRHLDKLAALGRFTSSIAHEIRNPLAGITAGIQYLGKRMDGPSREHVDFILAEVDRMNRIIEDLFRAGRPLHLQVADADMEALVERSLRMLEPRFAERQVRCVRHIEPDLPRVAVDADRIEQVLINLVQNAVEASPEGAAVEIEMRCGGSQGPLAAGVEPECLVIAVRDHGEGITEENRDKIFEPFFTTKARGTGLGLYVCHGIVEGHGGSIVVESAGGQGTRFVVQLPLGRILMGGASETADLARR
jgi:PAS domain S-box-containing protein